jgi:predicted molibdopterin-dependent oxidoreductase YjgC
VEVLGDLLSRFDDEWSDEVTPGEVFDKMAADLPAFSGLAWEEIPATGAPLQAPSIEPEPAPV